MFFTFQESRIWEHGNPPDPAGRKKRVKAKDVRVAQRQLPKDIQLGRVWVLVSSTTPKE